MSLKARFEATNFGHTCNKKTSLALAMAIYSAKHTASALCDSVRDLQNQLLVTVHQMRCSNSNIKSRQKQWKGARWKSILGLRES